MSHEAQINEAKAILNFMFAGNSIFTLRSVTSDVRYTYKIVEAEKRNPNDPQTYFLKVLTGPDNLRDYVYVGIIRDQQYRWTSKAKMTEKSGPIVAFTWAFNQFKAGTRPTNLEFYHIGRCGRCGRPLTVPESVATGIGPDCAAQMGIEQVVLPKTDPELQAALAHNKQEYDRRHGRVQQTQNFLFDAVDPAKEAASDVAMEDDSARYTRIKKFHDSCDDFGDAKYLALAQEAGITIEDLEWFSRRQKNDADYAFAVAEVGKVAEKVHAEIQADWLPAQVQQAEDRTKRIPAPVKVEVLTNAKVDAALVRKMVTAKRNNDPEGFTMDGEMDVDAAVEFWTLRYTKMPLAEGTF